MKTILIPTDFSANATHAAEYGYYLARQLKANVILCNAFVIPVEMPQANLVAWPMYEYDAIIESCENDIKKLKEHLEKNNTESFVPPLKCINEPGALQDVVTELVNREKADLIVMGAHGASGLSGFILGNHSRRMIDYTTRPLLIVPDDVKPLPVKKIAFASDFKNVADDLGHIYNLISIAKQLNAEILLTYVFDEKQHSKGFEKYLDEMLVELSNKANYPKIYYRLIKSRSVETGLDWLCDHGQVDMLAMVHRPHNFLDKILKGSHTQKMANRISLPLLVFPAN